MGGAERSRGRLLEGRDESGHVPEFREELPRSPDLRLRDPKVVPRVRLACAEKPDGVRPALLQERPRLDVLFVGAVLGGAGGGGKRGRGVFRDGSTFPEAGRVSPRTSCNTKGGSPYGSTAVGRSASRS